MTMTTDKRAPILIVAEEIRAGWHDSAKVRGQAIRPTHAFAQEGYVWVSYPASGESGSIPWQTKVSPCSVECERIGRVWA